MDTTTPNGMDVLKRMEHWGYYLLPKSHPASPGYGGLQIAIREEPTRKHFDPDTVDLHVISIDGTLSESRLHLDTDVGQRRVPLTRIILHDRLENKDAKFFTFGGQLEAVYGRHETVFTLRTPVPLLDLTSPTLTPAEELAVETERLLGMLQAAWGRDDEGFGRALARVGPVELYQATLRALIGECHPVGAYHCSEAFVTMLREEEGWLLRHGEGVRKWSTLEELLAPPEGGS